MYKTIDGKLPSDEVFSLSETFYPRGDCVYVLQCRYSNDLRSEEVNARKKLSEEPRWLERAVGAPERVYVGYTSRPKKRISQHLAGGSNFTTLFEPIGLLDIWDSMDETKARSFEEEIAERIRIEHPHWFVYQQ